ncbi:FlgD immunoglobulin-like domain containing protein [Candidatus Poribacteria bacterium]
MSTSHQATLSIFLLALAILPTEELNAYEPLFIIGKPALSDTLYSPDGRFLATLTSSYLELLDAETYAPVTRVDLASGVRSRFAFSPDSSLLAISGVEEGIQIWHVDSETFVANIPDEHDETIIAFSPDGKYLAYANDDSVFLWDVEQKETVIELTGDPNPSAWFGRHRVEGIAFHPNSKILAVGSYRSTIALWDMETGEILSYLELGFEDCQSGNMLFSHDGAFLVAGARYGLASDRTMRLWEVATGESKHYSGTFHGFTFTFDDQHLLAGGGNGNLHVIDTDTLSRKVIRAIDRPQPASMSNFNRLEHLTLHPDGKRLVTQINDSRIRIWDAQDFSRIHTIYGYGRPNAESLYLPGFNRIVTGKNTNVLNFWDSETGELVKAFEFYYPIRHMRASPNGRDIAIEVEVTHQLWDAANIEQIEILDDVETGGLVREIGFSPSGKYLASICWMGTFVWDVEKGRKLTWGEDDSMKVGYFSCRLLKFTLDESQIVTTLSDLDENQSTAIWDIETGELVDEIDHVGPLANLDDDFLQARQVDDTIEIRMLKSDNLICRIPDKPRTLEPCDFFWQRQFHPSGSVLAVRYAGTDRGGRESRPWEYRFYNTQTGELIAAVPDIEDFHFAADGSYMFLVDDKQQLGLYRTSDVIGQPVPLIVSVDPSNKKITRLGQIKQAQLLQNYPNPFNPDTWIPYQLAKDSEAAITIYDAAGQVVRILDLGRRKAGYSTIHWDGRNDSGQPLASGLYFYVLKANDKFSDTKKMVLLR